MFITRTRQLDRYIYSGILILTMVLLGSACYLRQSDTVRQQVNLHLPTSRISEISNKIPLSFEVNNGQVDSSIKFLAKMATYQLSLTSNGAQLTFPQSAQTPAAKLDMQFVAANPDVKTSGLEPIATKTNYLIGNDSQQWQTGIAHYARVQYREIYPGIDLVYYGNQQQLEYDLIVAAGADPRAIRLRFDNSQLEISSTRSETTSAAMPQLKLDNNGDLIVKAIGGELHKKRPVIYQQINGEKRLIAGNYLIEPDNQIAFQIDDYDHNYALFIDPVMSYSSYFGGANTEQAAAIALDSAGNIYIVGSTSSMDLPTAKPLQNRNGGSFDVFVAKFNPAGNSLIYTTYLGGRGLDQGFGIAVDNTGNAYITGATGSEDFPTANPLQAVRSGGRFDLFVAKLNPAGDALIYSTYFGGNDDDQGFAIAVNSAGNAFITGSTSSANFPISPNVTRPGGDSDAFILKLNVAGNGMVYSTLLGGSDEDEALSIAIDAADNAYVTGDTFSTNFPVVAGLQTKLSGNQDAFIAKIDAKGKTLLYSTYLGGNGNEEGLGIALDSAGNICVVGSTFSTDFPVAKSVQAFGGGKDAFITKLNATGDQLIFSSFYGGRGDDTANAIALDIADNIYVVGGTLSSDFPLVRPLQATNAGLSDAFILKLSASGSVSYASYLGGNASDESFSVVTDQAGNAYLTGVTVSSDFPTLAPLQATTGGSVDGFITRVADMETTPMADFTIAVTPANQMIMPGASTSFTITTKSLNNFTDPIDLSFAVTPADSNISSSISTTMVNSGGTATLTVNAAAATSARSFNIVITAISNQITHTATATVDVVNSTPTPDFELQFDPSVVVVNRRETGVFTVGITRNNGFTGNIKIIPPDTKALKIKLSPPSQSTTDTSVKFNYKVKGKAPQGGSDLIFMGQDDSGRVRTGTLTVIVQ